MRVLLISTYDLGRQPFGLASPAAWLKDAGNEVVCADLAKGQLPHDAVREADLIAFFLPMHTATRLALPVIDEVRALNARARLVAYGLYAPLNADLLREQGIDEILGGEFEKDLVDLASRSAQAHAEKLRATYGTGRGIPRLDFRVPARDGLPPLSRYATLQVGAARVTAGYTEASRGCKHRCRHCPVVPVYDGRFRVVAPDVVLADARNQVDRGARHITFGDPDFFNGVKHAVAVVEAFARELPGVTYDVTIKVEHLVKHAALVPVLRDTGCAFVTTAVESIDDAVLAKLEKGHTRADFVRVVSLFRHAGLTLAPTFVAFTPWTTLEGYLELLAEIDRLELVDNVAPIQLAIRLLIPHGSRLLELDDVRAVVTHFDPRSLVHVWPHPDSRLDALQRRIETLVGVSMRGDRQALFTRIWEAAHEAAGMSPSPIRRSAGLPRAAIPYLNEPWYC